MEEGELDDVIEGGRQRKGMSGEKVGREWREIQRQNRQGQREREERER